MNSPKFNRYPILDLKQPPTGIVDTVYSASVKQSYIQTASTIYPMTKILCIQYNPNYVA